MDIDLSLAGLANDFRYASRTLQKNPGFALAAIVTLALGIGATTAIFTVINGVLIRPLQCPDAERLVGVWHFGVAGNRRSVGQLFAGSTCGGRRSSRRPQGGIGLLS